MGDCYYNGIGVNQNYEEATKWFKLAGYKKGLEMCNRELAELKKKTNNNISNNTFDVNKADIHTEEDLSEKFVFISYSSSEYDEADAIRNVLNKNNIKC